MSRIAFTPSVSASLTASLVVAFAILSLAVLAAVVASLIKASFSALERLVGKQSITVRLALATPDLLY